MIKIFDLMRRLCLFIIIISSAYPAISQTRDFDKVYNACIKINSSFSDGFANAEQLSAAAQILSSVKIGRLNLVQIKGQNLSLKGHLVFTPNFILNCIDNAEIYNMADDYANSIALYRGGEVLMSTILIPAHETSIYKIEDCYDEVNIGCIAETNGLFSWTIKIENTYLKSTELLHNDGIDEIKGRPARHRKIYYDDPYSIILEITNTSDLDSSFAIIAQ